MINGDYFRGAPDLVAEVLSPPSREIDRGPRFLVYERACVPRLWLLDPELETVETYSLAGQKLHLDRTYRAGDQLIADLFPVEAIDVSKLFETQAKRHGDVPAPREPRPIPEWIISPEVQLGLEYFFLLGHPDRRWEIWGNRCHSVLAFGSATEAKARLGNFVREACQWEGVSLVTPQSITDSAEQAEVGRFKLTRTERYVKLDVAVDALKYQQLLEVWARDDVWDWGEED
jgi:putative restriction endonuclease